MNNKFTRWSISSFIILMTFWISIDLYSRSSGSGISGLTASNSGGCSCHTSSPNSATSLSVSSSSGSFKLQPGNELTLTVSVQNSSLSKAGVNIAVKTTETGSSNAGTLNFESGSGLRSENGEITHSTPKSISGGKADFVFTWTAPSTPGTYYLRAIGNAVDGDGGADGQDQHNWMTPKQIVVAGVNLTAPTASANWCTSTNQTITWTSAGIDNVKIELSDNGGSSYATVIASSVAASGGTYSWSVPNTLTSGNNYKIRISDAADPNFKSESSSFQISQAPQITTQPQSQEVCEGTTATLTVAISGSATSYNWKKNGTSVQNTASPTLVLSNVSANDAGDYTVTINNPCGSPIESNIAKLTVNQSAGITTQPQGQTVCEGTSLNLVIAAKGKNKQIKWFKNNTEISGAISETLTINNVTSGDEGNYSATVTADCGNPVNSNIAAVKVISQPQITTQPKATTICEGSQLSISVIATGGSSNTYIWEKDGNVLSNQNSNILIVEKATLADAGNYKVTIDGECGSNVTSEEALVVVNPLPAITLQPKSIQVTTGSKVELKVNATNAKSYQWRKNGNNINGAINADLIINSASLDDNGNYDCIVKNDCGEKISEAAKVTVEQSTGGPNLSVSQSDLSLGNTKLNQSKNVTLENFLLNSGDETLTISQISLTGDGAEDFKIESALPINILSGKTASIELSFTPKTAKEYIVKLNFTSNSKTNPEVTITATGAEYKIELSERTVVFANTTVGSSSGGSFDIINKSNVEVNISSIKLSGDNPDMFAVNGNPAPFTLAANQSKKVEFTFNPTSAGNFEAKVDIAISETDVELQGELKGSAVVSDVEDSESDFSVKLYPNPSQQTFSFEVNSSITENLTIKIYSELGNLIDTINGKTNSVILWDNSSKVNNYPSNGSYYAEITYGKNRIIKKLILAK